VLPSITAFKARNSGNAFLKYQFVPHSKHWGPKILTNRFMLFREQSLLLKDALKKVYCARKMNSLFSVKAGGINITRQEIKETTA
jgi:hypothetical protein